MVRHFLIFSAFLFPFSSSAQQTQPAPPTPSPADTIPVAAARQAIR